MFPRIPSKLALALVLALLAPVCHAAASASASLSGFLFILTDLDPYDGVTPSLTLQTQVFGEDQFRAATHMVHYAAPGNVTAGESSQTSAQQRKTTTTQTLAGVGRALASTGTWAIEGRTLGLGPMTATGRIAAVAAEFHASAHPGGLRRATLRLSPRTRLKVIAYADTRTAITQARNAAPDARTGWRGESALAYAVVSVIARGTGTVAPAVSQHEMSSRSLLSPNGSDLLPIGATRDVGRDWMSMTIDNPDTTPRSLLFSASVTVNGASLTADPEPAGTALFEL